MNRVKRCEKWLVARLVVLSGFLMVWMAPQHRQERMGLFRVVKLLSEKRGWILSHFPEPLKSLHPSGSWEFQA